MFEFQPYLSPAVPSVDVTGAFEQLSSLSVARSLNVPSGRRVNYCMVQADGQNVRYRDDGTDPTASIGMILIAGDPPTKFTHAFSLLRFVEAASGAKLNVRYY